MADALEAMAFGANENRRFLASAGAQMQRREVVGGELERVEQVVHVLDVDDGAQSSERGADPLPEDGRLADPRVDHPLIAVLGLQPLEDQVHVAELPDVLAENDDARVAPQVLIEAANQDEPAIHGLRPFDIGRRDRADTQRRLRRAAVEIRLEALVVLPRERLDEDRELRSSVPRATALR